MAYTQAELESYWSDVNDGSVLSGAAPNAFQNSTTFSADQTDDLQDIRDTSFMDRQAAMDFSDKYQTDPEEAQLLSERLSGVLASDSPYIQRARTMATEKAAGRGLLNSSMASGAAEGAAIDRGLQVAQGDVDVDKFNVGATNAAEEMRYKASQDIGGSTQDFQNQLGASEAGHIFDVGLAEEKQEDKLETMDEEYKDKLALQNAAAADQMETDMLKYTNDRTMEMLRKESELHSAYLQAYGQIAMADITVADKNSQLLKLGQQIDNAVAANADYKNIVITGSGGTDTPPQYSISGI